MADLFEPFVQVAPGRYRTTGGLGLGLGLGLTLVKRLVQMHGGTVRASGGGVGQGTTFEVRVPTEPVAVSDSEPAAAQKASA